MKIMIIDDEPDVKLLFEQRFRHELRAGQYEFLYAFSAEEALESLKTAAAADVVLILSDINMPGMSGIELLRLLKQERPALRVIMITAYNDSDSYHQAMEYGADDFLSKPIDFSELKQTLSGLESGEST